MILRLFLTAALAACWSAAWAADTKVTLLHVNDVYEIEPNKGLGGLAELASALKRQRARHRNAITVVAGDFLSPSLLSGRLKGAQMIDLFNRMGVDYVTFGNHEFDFGADVLKQRMSEAKFVWVSSNVFGKDGRPFGGAVTTATRDVGGVKLGFLGLLTRETAAVSNPGENVVIRPEIEAAKQAVDSLKAEGAQVIVALTHMDVAQDRELARAVTGIDVILGGHEHDPITYYEHGVLISKTGSDARFLGVVDLKIHTGEKGEKSIQPEWALMANRDIRPEPAILARVRDYKGQLDQELSAQIGKTSVDLDTRATTLRTGETAIGNIVADALRENLHAHAALMNGGSIRGGGVIPAGSALTKGDIMKLLPFGSTGVLLKVKGWDVLAALENGVSEVENAAGRFPQISGMAFVYDPKAKAGSRVRSVTIDGKPLDPNAYYKLATNDYVARGADGYTALAGAELLTDPRFTILIANMTIDHIKACGSVAPTAEKRISTQ